MKNKHLRVSYAKAVHGKEEEKRVLNVLREHRTIIGRETNQFESRVAKFNNKKYGVMVNSGSSANLLAIELLNLPIGSEVITPLLTFATTVTPLVQKGLVPVFVDVEEGTYNVNVEQVEQIITKKTKAMIIPLLLGNVPNLSRLSKLAKKYNLFFIDDSCDTFAAKFAGKPTGYYTDVTTTSFYGSHIITAGGGGGMVMVNSKDWNNRARVLRGWGRSSSVFSESESINKRFKTKIGGIQYDAKFLFDEIGYNFLPIEMGSAFGNAQLDKLEKFRQTRKKNFDALYSFFKKYEDLFILPVQDKNVETQWLAFPITLRKSTPFNRLQLVTFLEKHNIQTRPIFTGNILKQPGFKKIPHRIDQKNTYENTNSIMQRGVLIGCHHGMQRQHLDWVKEVFVMFLKKFTS